MPSPQEIREKTFEKAVFGGYDMAQVDNFLAELSDELQGSQKEISVLKTKMKVLVEKIEEYRENEDAMRLALVSAQKISTQIQNDAEQKCAEMLESAQLKSEQTIAGVRGAVSAQEKILADTKLKSAEFIEHLRSLSKRHLEFLDIMAASEPDLAMLTGVGSKAAMETKFAPVWEEDLLESGIGDNITGDDTPEPDVNNIIDDSPTKNFTPVISDTLQPAKAETLPPLKSENIPPLPPLEPPIKTAATPPAKPAAPAEKPAEPKIAKPRLNFDDLRFGGKE